jgi:hypothetical protein
MRDGVAPQAAAEGGRGFLGSETASRSLAVENRFRPRQATEA